MTSPDPSSNFQRPRWFRIQLVVAATAAVVALSGPSPCHVPDPRCEIPAGLVVIASGQSIQAAVDANPEGTSFLLTAGYYRRQTVRPKAGNAFYGERGSDCSRLSVLSGASFLRRFEPAGELWVATGQTQEGQQHGFCEAGWDRCSHPEDLFLDGEPLKHATSLDGLQPGEWFFDYEGDAIYLAEDPGGRLVETSVTRVAFKPTAPDVRIEGLVVEKYAIPGQMGAVGEQSPQSGWQIVDNEVRWNHGVGIQTGDGNLVARNHVHHNGQLGIGGVGTGIQVEGNEIAYNNFAHFLPVWEAGGAKFSLTTDLVVRDNCVHHNRGHGLWTDTDNVGTLHQGNVVYWNLGQGIFHEISGQAVIRDNRVGHNGAVGGWLYGTNILLSTSRDVEVTENRVEVNPSFGNAIAVVWQDRGEAYTAIGNEIHHNDVTFLGSGGVMGAASDFEAGHAQIFEGNVFDANSYHMPSLPAGHFAWNGTTLIFTSFQAAGQEATGTAQAGATGTTWSCDTP